MFNFLSYVLRKRRIKNDALLDSSSEDSRIQNAQFVSLLQKSGFRKRQLDRHDKGAARAREAAGLLRSVAAVATQLDLVVGCWLS